MSKFLIALCLMAVAVSAMPRGHPCMRFCDRQSCMDTGACAQYCPTWTMGQLQCRIDAEGCAHGCAGDAPSIESGSMSGSSSSSLSSSSSRSSSSSSDGSSGPMWSHKYACQEFCYMDMEMCAEEETGSSMGSMPPGRRLAGMPGDSEMRACFEACRGWELGTPWDKVGDTVGCRVNLLVSRVGNYCDMVFDVKTGPCQPQEMVPIAELEKLRALAYQFDNPKHNLFDFIAEGRDGATKEEKKQADNVFQFNY